MYNISMEKKMVHKVFAYGSLMCVNSCEKTIKRKVEYQLVELINFQRTFNAFGVVMLTEENKQEVVRFANIQKTTKKTSCYGLIFEVTEEELVELIKREKNYKLVEVSDNIYPYVEKVWTFIYENNEYNKGIVLKHYLDIMFNASIQFPQLHNQIKKEIKQVQKTKIINQSLYSLCA